MDFTNVTAEEIRKYLKSYGNINEASCFEVVGDVLKLTGTPNKWLLHEAIKGLPKSKLILEALLLFEDLDVNVANKRKRHSNVSGADDCQNKGLNLNTPIMQVFRMSEILSEDYTKYLIDELISRGAELNYKNTYGESVVMTAIHHGCLYGLEKCQDYLYPEILEDMYELDGRSCWVDFDPSLALFLYSKYPEMIDCNGDTYPEALTKLRKVIPEYKHETYFDLLKKLKKEQFMKSLNKRSQVSDHKMKQTKVDAKLYIEIPWQLREIYDVTDFYNMLYKNNYNMNYVQNEIELFGAVRKEFNLIEFDRAIDKNIFRDRKKAPKKDKNSKQEEEFEEFEPLPF